eukprot:scaffold2253_cov286-Chaetoceros_neogracile.AAC.11
MNSEVIKLSLSYRQRSRNSSGIKSELLRLVTKAHYRTAPNEMSSGIIICLLRSDGQNEK